MVYVTLHDPQLVLVAAVPLILQVFPASAATGDRVSFVLEMLQAFFDAVTPEVISDQVIFGMTDEEV